MEGKGAVKCTKRISNANIFEAAVSRGQAQNRLIDELMSLFGGSVKPVMARLVETGDLTLEDIKEAEKAIRRLGRKDGAK
jgi:predicted transcriptional regulator